MSFLPLGLLVLVDILILAFVVSNKVRHRANRTKISKGQPRSRKSFIKRTATTLGAEQQVGQYEELGDDEFALTPRIMRVDTGFGGEVPLGFDPDEDHSEELKKPSSDLELFIRSMSRCIGATNFGLSFEFEDLAFHPQKAAKPILSEVTGKIDRGTLSGVMGASGAGKSTFVNVLMGKQNHTGGTTKINGVAGNISKYKKIIGYVPQDDIVLPELTVRENILHSARIRLPSNWSDAEIQGHVDILISCLQLAHVKDSYVGSAAAPVISGGQRKRVSIGMELAALPMALLLDEPTSGLDATSAASIMTTLKELSRLGITVVTIIHQPRQEIFESLDNLLLFGAGRMIYSGPEDRVQQYFEDVGFRFPPHGNPADAVMDIIAGQGRVYKLSGDTDVIHLIEHWKNRELNFRKHASLQSVSTQETQALRKSIRMRGAPWYRQIYYCFARSILQQYRLKASFFAELGVGALAGFLIGLAQLSQEGIQFRGLFINPYEVLSSSLDYSSVPQMSLLVGLSIGLTASSPGVKIFGEEKLIYWREAASGHNRFAYYMGKVLSTIPRMVLANFHFSVFFYLLTTPRISWIAAFTANLLYFWCIYGLASCISMITRREDGPLLAVMLSLVVGVLNGMSPSLRQVRIWHLQWLWRASPGTWLAEGYFDRNIAPLEYLYQIHHAADYLGYRIGQFPLDLGMLMVIGTVCRVLAFVLMRAVNRNKQK